MKKICILILTTVLFLFLTSCYEDTTQLAKDEFLKYFNGKNDVVVNIGAELHFEEHILYLDDLIENNEHESHIVFKDRVIVATSEDKGMFDFELNIYETNFTGTETKLLFSKGEYNTSPHIYAQGDKFYIQHYSNNAFDTDSRLIDLYTVSTGVYENIASGNDCRLSDYSKNQKQSNYSVEIIENESPQEHGKFIITDSTTGIQRTIDDEYLKNTIYIESMEIFNYAPYRFDVSNGHLLLTYSIGAGDGQNASHLVFEYKFDSNTLEYKLLAFPYDRASVDITYII